jgi:hypothetical protein
MRDNCFGHSDSRLYARLDKKDEMGGTVTITGPIIVFVCLIIFLKSPSMIKRLLKFQNKAPKIV